MKLLGVCLLIPAVFARAEVRVGIVSVGSAQAIAFTQLLNDVNNADHLPGARVVAAYTGGRVDKLSEELKAKWKVDIMPDVGALCRKVDAVMIGTENPGERVPQIKTVIAAGKSLFIESPLAATLDEARAIIKLARASSVPWFSASGIRFGPVLDIKGPSVLRATTWGPAPIEKGAYAVEMLYALMGTGCEEVVYGDLGTVLSGRWAGDRLGSVRTATDKGLGALAPPRPQIKVTPDYRSLLVEIIKFFETKQPPVSSDETLEIFEFLDAAQRSKAAGGASMKLR